MRNIQLIIAAALLPLGFAGGIACEKVIAHEHAVDQTISRIKAFEDFDYDRCNWIVSELSKAPEQFKEARRTPGGNWCITVEV